MAKIFEFPSDAHRIQNKIEKRLAQTMERLPLELAECIRAAIKEVTSQWVQRLGFTMDLPGVFNAEQEEAIYDSVNGMIKKHAAIMENMGQEIMALKAQVCDLEYRLSKYE
jgi:hypothetical protein